MSKPKKVVRGKKIYRGRSKRPGKILRGVLFALLLFLLVGIGYIVCKEWAKYFGPNAVKPESSAEIESSLPSSESSEESEPQTVQAEIKGITVPYEKAQLTGGALDSYLADLKAQGYTHVFVELKNENGSVLFQTDAAQAVSFGSTDANAFDAAVFTAAVQKAELTPGAVITALRDPLVSHVRNNNSFAYADQLGTNWMDSTPALGGKSWLNPYMDNARSYIAELAGDAAQKGFSLIVLTDVNFPTRNTAHMNTIKTEPSRNAILGQMLSEVQSAAGDVPVLNSLDLAEQLMLSGNAPYTDMQEIGYSKNAPYISLSEIEQNKAALAEKFGTEADSTAIARTMLTRLAADGALTETFVPVISSADIDTLLPVLTELSLSNYIVL